MSFTDQMRAQRTENSNRAKALLDKAIAEKRDLNPTEEREFNVLRENVTGLTETIRREEARELEDRQVAETFERLGLTHGDGSTPVHPLAYDATTLTAIARAMSSRDAGRFGAFLNPEQRAALATSTLGAPRAFGANVLAGPRLLHVVAGVPSQEVDAIYAQHSKFELPTAGASVGENVTLAEYDDVTAGSVTLARFGRFTDMSTESRIGTDAAGTIAMHRIGIAKDLDAALVNAVETEAGAAVAFAADVPAQIRKAMAGVLDNTAADDPSQLVILANPADVNLLQDVTPVGGESIGQRFLNFSGALVYPTSAADAGLMTVANLQAGTRWFQARGLGTEVDASVKTGTVTVATSIIGGYGVGLTSGFAIKVDVVA
jgi:hypothetical protein